MDSVESIKSPSMKLDKSANSSSTAKSDEPPKTEVKVSLKGVENAKKRLRAFSIQKKTPITPVALPKPVSAGNTTVVIGKLSSVKVTPKPDESDVKKPPKPPKPGTARKLLQDSYSELQKKTLAEIEDMKRKMELVELGIPLGLICPTSTSEKAMPTKAMPPIKTFLDPEKLDEIIREAKKAKEEGRRFKFDYQKILPDYDNPFQRKKDDPPSEKDHHYNRRKSESGRDKEHRSDKYDYRRHSDHRKDDKYKYRSRDKAKSKSESKNSADKPTEKETNVNLNDYLVCDSWSLDNDDKNNSSSPKVSDTKITGEPSEILKKSIAKNNEVLKKCVLDSPTVNTMKIEKLQPVMDTFKYEIDPNDDEILDIFDEQSDLKKYSQATLRKPMREESPNRKKESDPDAADSINDDLFLESIIDEIKQEGMSEDECNEKGLVEYDMSPSKDDSPIQGKSSSATPDIDERSDSHSQRSDYSGYTSADSIRTTDTSESGYKSVDSYRLSVEKELDECLAENLPKSTVDSLEMWSFVLKICQPLLFRHDKNKCYKETRSSPKIWYTENPKICKCVKDRKVVYEELEQSKMNLVDRVYGCDQIPEAAFAKCRSWYPRNGLCPTESTVPLSNEWEADDSQQDGKVDDDKKKSTTPKGEEISLDREYQRFMEAVWPDVVESKVESSRSTTPVRQESKKKKKEETMKEMDDKKTKKIKLSSEGWSQESDVEEDERSKKIKEKEKPKMRKRRHSSTTQSSLSDSDDSKKKTKALKKKALKKVKSKSSKRRRVGRKLLKKLKEKQKIKKKIKKSEADNIEERKRSKKYKKKKQLKLKKKSIKKKKAKVKSSSSSETSSSESDSETDSESDRKAKKAKKNQETKKKKSKKRKQSTSDSTQSEELFDVNVLNNIKTERLTDDEQCKKMMDFSPRRQKPREIINVKEFDFVGNNVQIKQEVEEGIQEECVSNVELIETTQKEREKGEQIEEEVDEPVDETLQEVTEVKESVEEKKLEPDVKTVPEESNISQTSSQESVCSVKEPPTYEKDDSYLRPSSQNSNYSFNDVINANQSAQYPKHVTVVSEEEKYSDGYEAGSYEMYEHLAMAYQSDVASQRVSPPQNLAQRIETVVHARCGEIKCDWRPGSVAEQPSRPQRPSRWGLKPGQVNIVLTGGSEVDEPPSPPQFYPIQSLAKRTEISTGYDEAYLDMYGASDRLQYGDCFSENDRSMELPGIAKSTGNASSAVITVNTENSRPVQRLSRLDERIDRVLNDSVLGEVVKEIEEPETERDAPEKGILLSAAGENARGLKRVSFADGYKPGQDSDVEEPPVKKRKKVRRSGCAWPCPASHPDHVPLWDALPPPPPPPGSPPRRKPRIVQTPGTMTGIPTSLLQSPGPMMSNIPLPLHTHPFDPIAGMGGFMGEPPPALVAL